MIINVSGDWHGNQGVDSTNQVLHIMRAHIVMFSRLAFQGKG